MVPFLSQGVVQDRLSQVCSLPLRGLLSEWSPLLGGSESSLQAYLAIEEMPYIPQINYRQIHLSIS